MLSATANAKLLKKATRASNAFLNETRVRISEEGIAIRTVDAGNICLTDIFIPKEDFEAFRVEEGVIGLNVGKLNDVLKAVKDDFVEVEGDKNKNLKLKAGKARYSIALIDPASLKAEPKLPVLNLKAETIVDASDFKNAVSMASKVADNVVFSADDGFQIVAEGDTEDVRIDLSEGYAGSEQARVMLSLEYLKEIAKVVDKDDAVRIAIGTDLPVRVSIESEFSTTILYFIAPRIEVK